MDVADKVLLVYLALDAELETVALRLPPAEPGSDADDDGGGTPWSFTAPDEPA